MTESKFGELTLEQKFAIQKIGMDLSDMPTDVIKMGIMATYTKMIQLDNHYKQIIKEKWGIENGLTK